MILFTIIGAIIGAGFASGQEIYLFFYRFGKNGLYGIILCNIIMSLVIYLTLKIIYKYNIYSYKEFLGRILKDNAPLENIINIIVNLFLCITFFIMISGFGTYLGDVLNINKIIGSCILACISYNIFLKNVDSLAKINSILIPVLIAVITIIGIENLRTYNFYPIIKNEDTSKIWILQAILYSSYNLILVEPVLINLKKFLKNKKQIGVVSIGVGVFISILAILEFFLLNNVENFNKIEMPLVYVIQTCFTKFSYWYGAIILIAIFSTAESVGLGFLNNICKDKKSFPQIAFIMCITSILVSPIGFTNLINNLFPLFGFLGLIEMYYIIKTGVTLNRD